MTAAGTTGEEQSMFDVVSAPDLRLGSDGPVLVGGRCADCGVVAFPRPGSCARCTGDDVVEHVLTTTGTLWTWTVQGFRPKTPYDGPEEFEPYGVGYVDLGGEVLVEGRLTVSDPALLAIGQRVVLEAQTYAVDVTGRRRVTFAFTPQEDVA